MRTIRIAILLMAITFFAFACQKQTYKSGDDMVKEAMKTVKIITVDELDKIMENGEEIYTLIDVRQEIEHYYGYIPGSVVLPRGSLEFSIADAEFWENAGLYMPEKDEKIILYCKKGQRGILAAETLTKLGYTNVYAIEGGWKNWEVNYPDIYEKDLDKLGGKSEAPASSGGC
ncbi:MAG: rhodanese-like domain-containing protein [Bacteroidales bacterium]|nr:rhodanese-like domain-containing protein [Bacteroidales bacterium]